MISTHRILDKRIKPIAIPLKHPLYDTSTELCLITKDPQKVFKEWVKSKDMKNIKKVIGITKFQKKYSSFEDKRSLCDSYDLFLADDRILSYLPKLLGKYFFEKKKQPIPVKISKETTFCKEILKSCHSTYLHFSSGTYFAIKIGKSDMTSRQIVENIEISVPKIIEKIPRKWRNIQSLSIKTNSSTSLPIFNSLPEISKLVINKPIDDDEKEKLPGQNLGDRYQRYTLKCGSFIHCYSMDNRICLLENVQSR
ncbi:7926_t:CDS:2 [Entrophospora sp. SA101]|nr:7926_t:CDS:2 [Entrophospora sp. SA101]